MENENLGIENRLYSNPKYSNIFLTELKLLYEEKKFTDVMLKCSDSEEKILCHKLVLSAFSPYFKAMFSSNLIENKTNQVSLSSTDFKTLNHIVNYAYTGSISLNVNNVQSIFSLANLLQIDDLVNSCCDFMESKLDICNSIDLYKFSKQNLCDYLTKTSREFINLNITEILKTNEFLELNEPNLIIDIFKSDDLDISNEALLLDYLFKWLEYDYENRITFFQQICNNSIRFNLIDNLNSYLDKYESILNKDLLNKFNYKKRLGMFKAEICFLLIGGNCDLADAAYVNCFNPFNGDKYYVSKNYLDRQNLGYFHVENPGVCLSNENKIYIAGGVYVFHKYKNISDSNNILKDGDETISKEVFEYDGLNNAWIKKTNMLFAKANFSLCSFKDRIYSFGGISTGQIPIDIVEYYDIPENKWSYVCTMPNPFVAGCVVEHKDVFYVLGGRNGVGRHEKCFSFNPDTCVWSELDSFKIGRFNFGACVIDDKIYAFGGQRYSESEENYFTREALDSVEVFDLNVSKKWSLGSKMPAPLYNTGVCVVYDDEDNQNENKTKKCKSIYLCGTTECQFSGTTLFGFMFTSVFRLDFIYNVNNHIKEKWKIVEHDVSDIKAYYRCIAGKVNTRKLYKFQTDIEIKR